MDLESPSRVELHRKATPRQRGGGAISCSRPFPLNSNSDWSRVRRVANPGRGSGSGPAAILSRASGPDVPGGSAGRTQASGGGQVGAGRRWERRRRGQDERGGGGPGGGHLQPALHPAADLLVRVPAGGVAVGEASAQSLPG